MAANKNGLANFLDTVLAARDKTNDKLKMLALESGGSFFGSSADLYKTFKDFVETYHDELDGVVKQITKPDEGSFRARKSVDCAAFKIVNTVKHDANRGYFQLGEESFKIHWIRRDSPALKGIALEMVNSHQAVIQYGSGEDECLSPILCIVPAVIHAIYRFTPADRGDVFGLWREIVEYITSALESLAEAHQIELDGTGQSFIRKEQSEQFNFEDTTIIVYTAIRDDGDGENSVAYMTVAKDAEFVTLLSYSEVHLAEQY